MYTFIVVVYACLTPSTDSCHFYVKKMNTKWEIECLAQLDKDMDWFNDMKPVYADGTCVGPLKVED